MRLFFWCILFSLSAVSIAETPWKFIISGDSRGSSISENNGLNAPIVREIAAEIVRQGAEFVLCPGDLVLGGGSQADLESQLRTWRACMQPVYDAGIGVYPVRGNHDQGVPADTTAWKSVFSDLPANGPQGELGLTYAVAHKNVLILALDAYVNLMRVNQNWIDDQLNANTLPHVLAISHVPAFKVEHSTCLDDYPAQRDAFWQSLKNAGGRTYVCGHDHFYDHTVIDDLDGSPANDIHQYVLGTGGAPIGQWSPPYTGTNSGMIVRQWHHREQFGYLLVEVTDDSSLRTTWFERSPVTGLYSPAAGSADLGSDQLVNIADLASMAGQWLRFDCRAGDFCGGADVDQLTTVDLKDFGLLAAQWQKVFPRVLEFGILAGSDDAEQDAASGAMLLDSTDLELVKDAADQVVGLRFANVAIPPDARIAAAWLQFSCDEISIGNPCGLMIHAEASDNAAPFTAAAFDVIARPRTAAVAWNPPDWTVPFVAGPGQKTPDITPLVESVIRRPGWQNGGAIAFIVTGTGRRIAESWERRPASAPRLIIQLQ